MAFLYIDSWQCCISDVQDFDETSSSVTALLPDALRYIYQHCLLEADQELLPAVVQVCLCH